MACCGILLVITAFVPKFAALLAMMPSPVVGAALCVGLGGQIGAAIDIISSQKLTSRDYFVVGLPVLFGTLAGLFPRSLFLSFPGSLQVFLGNSLIVGMLMVLIMEHLLFRRREPMGEE